MKGFCTVLIRDWSMALFDSNPELTRSSWLNCGLRDDEAVYWVIIGHYEAVVVGNW